MLQQDTGTYVCTVLYYTLQTYRMAETQEFPDRGLFGIQLGE